MSGKPTYALFIFDFDGTLGDTSECVVASLQGALQQNNLPIVERSAIVSSMGISLPQFFKKLTNNKYDEALYNKLVDDYRTLYRAYLTQKTKSFPHVNEVLEYLKTKGAKISIATSKKTEFAVASCEFLGIDKYIDFYIGDDMVKNKKPHPEMLTRTIQELGVKPANAVMIGDATTDIEMGKAYGIDTIAVTWGSHSRNDLEAVGPDYIVNDMLELKVFV